MRRWIEDREKDIFFAVKMRDHLWQEGWVRVEPHLVFKEHGIKCFAEMRALISETLLAEVMPTKKTTFHER